MTLYLKKIKKIKQYPNLLSTAMLLKNEHHIKIDLVDKIGWLKSGLDLSGNRPMQDYKGKIGS